VKCGRRGTRGSIARSRSKMSAQQFTDRFEREARAVAALNHPNICTLYDVGPDYLVMEYIEGKPLKGPLPVDRALKFAEQICDALDAAHRSGITHRDLKPANILLSKQGIKLLDFGLARIEPSPNDSNAPTMAQVTRTGAVMGTPAYMAPEQWEGKKADARSDICAFGCVLYEMLSGLRAFAGESAMEVMAAILRDELAPLQLPGGPAPAKLADVVMEDRRPEPPHRFTWPVRYCRR
jgi:serine/threonine protein kinase